MFIYGEFFVQIKYVYIHACTYLYECYSPTMFLQSNMDSEGDARDSEVGVAKVLPSTLVSESYSASEMVTMTTVNDEQYTCLLPDLSGESSSKVSYVHVTFPAARRV